MFSSVDPKVAGSDPILEFAVHINIYKKIVHTAFWKSDFKYAPTLHLTAFTEYKLLYGPLDTFWAKLLSRSKTAKTRNHLSI